MIVNLKKRVIPNELYQLMNILWHYQYVHQNIPIIRFLAHYQNLLAMRQI